MTKFHAAWKKNLVHQVKLGRPLPLAARIMAIGMDRIIFERNRDPEFAEALKEAEQGRLKQVQY